MTELHITQHQAPEQWQAIAAIREAVFINEQGITEADEWDEADQSARHFLARYKGLPVGCARLILSDNGDCQIGRMAVLARYRKQGVGGALISALIEYYLQQNRAGSRLFLHAQIQVVHFYQDLGFVEYGEAFMDAGIVHKKMYYLSANNSGR